jgi:hypothetical protein
LAAHSPPWPSLKRSLSGRWDAGRAVS